ncbi:CRISPR-associated DxTHG motif protein [Bacillus pacificus]|nr:CRISPR-associated DxTHG motif protein [Bacillus pacificus]USL21841.1 CRISPR-associated DxTHG motif protein [Bacillus paranthracis]MCC2386818.1 CRISPR-associated DxTHG motif protein [Bacillus pacificus]MCC2414749.1 CRISPR-associated DxTHG motif protein [Bacillus pacificus]MCC2469137.1 CRISPR-associated DxTHG motif protein [Bacillus pacificus]
MTHSFNFFTIICFVSLFKQ